MRERVNAVSKSPNSKQIDMQR